MANPTTVKIRNTQPYRIDWDNHADTLPEIKKQLGKTYQDIDYSFQIVFESIRSIVSQINILAAAGSGGSGTPISLKSLQGIPGLDGADGEDAFSGIIAIPAPGGVVNLGGSGVTGILPLNHGGSGSDLSATGGAHEFLRQNSVGANVDVVQPASSDLSDSTNIPLLNANNVWAGTATFNGAVGSANEWDVGADIHFRNPLAPGALGAGTTNDYNPTGLGSANVLLITPNGGGSNLSGIAAPSKDGKLLLLLNVGSATLSLLAGNAGSAAANRFQHSANVTVSAGGNGTLIWYDGTNTCWRILVP